MMTRDEKVWLKKLQEVLEQCPSSRLGFYTTGDRTVSVYDKTRQHDIDALMDRRNFDFGPAVEKVGADLGAIRFPSSVHSTAG